MTRDQFEKYLQGKCNEQETDAIERFLQEKDMNLDEFLSASDWNLAHDTHYTQEDQLKSNIRSRIEFQRHRSKRYVAMISTAVAAVLLIIMGVVNRLYQDKAPTLPLVQEHAKINVPTAPLVGNLFYINSTNQDMEIYCSDSSKILLAKGSEVRFADDFSGLKERKIELKGKATFRVTKDKNRPFRVFSDKLITTALGTTFLVEEIYGRTTRVQLIEGKIDVKERDRKSEKPIQKLFEQTGEIVLDHLQQKIISEVKTVNNQYDRKGFYKEEHAKIIIKNIPIKDLLNILEHNFNIKLKSDSYLAPNFYFSGTFKETPDAYADIIEEINYLHKTDIVVLKN